MVIASEDGNRGRGEDPSHTDPKNKHPQQTGSLFYSALYFVREIGGYERLRTTNNEICDGSWEEKEVEEALWNKSRVSDGNWRPLTGQADGSALVPFPGRPLSRANCGQIIY